jgi:hypothetical protein
MVSFLVVHMGLNLGMWEPARGTIYGNILTTDVNLLLIKLDRETPNSL